MGAVVETHEKKGRSKWIRIIGIALILLTWIFWIIIFTIPFMHLGFKTAAIATTALLIATNIFYVGVILVGKELAEKYDVIKWIKKWWRNKKSAREKK